MGGALNTDHSVDYTPILSLAPENTDGHFESIIFIYLFIYRYLI